MVDERQMKTPASVLKEQQAMKEKLKQVEQQRQGRSHNEEPHGKMSEHPLRKLG